MTPGARPFLAQGACMVEVHEVMLVPNIKTLDLVVSDKMFSCFSYISLCKTCGSRGEPIFGPRL